VASGAGVPGPEPRARLRPRPAGPSLALVACAGSTNVPFPVFMNRSLPADDLLGWDFFKVC
jgi:hypothetical protein